MHHDRLRPSRWQRLGLLLVGLLLVGTGAAWLALHGGAGGDGLPHPAEAWLMRLHGAAAFAALFGAGLMAGHHIPAGWRAAQRPRHAGQRRSGLLLCLMLGFSVASGYALYYFAPEWLRPTLGWLHSGVGAAMLLAGAWHGRHRARARQLRAKP
jgi:hypothetical protein